MHKLLFTGMILAAVAVNAVQDVAVTGLTMGPQGVTISYSLPSSGEAIITFDILTNGVSIGATNLTGGDTNEKPGITGDTNIRVMGPRNGTIVWKPYLTWKDASVTKLENVKAVVKAWSPFAPPDYMVIDLTKSGGGCCALLRE